MWFTKRWRKQWISNLRHLHGRSELDEAEDPTTTWMEGLIDGLEARLLWASFGTHTTARGLTSKKQQYTVDLINVNYVKKLSHMLDLVTGTVQSVPEKCM